MTSDGFWEYTRVPFGLKNAPAWFSRVMTQMLSQRGLKGTRSFVDDLITGGQTFEEYVDNQLALLECLRDHRWLISASTARFGYLRINILGHTIEKGKIYPDGDKVSSFKRLLPPNNLR